VDKNLFNLEKKMKYSEIEFIVKIADILDESGDIESVKLLERTAKREIFKLKKDSVKIDEQIEKNTV